MKSSYKSWLKTPCFLSGIAAVNNVMRKWEILPPQFWLLTKTSKRRLWHPKVYLSGLNVPMRSSRSVGLPLGIQLLSCTCSISVHWSRIINLVNQWGGTSDCQQKRRRDKINSQELKAPEKLEIRFRGCVWKARCMTDVAMLCGLRLQFEFNKSHWWSRFFSWKWFSHFWGIFKIVHAIGKSKHWLNYFFPIFCTVLSQCEDRIILGFNFPHVIDITVIKQNNLLWRILVNGDEN